MRGDERRVTTTLRDNDDDGKTHLMAARYMGCYLMEKKKQKRRKKKQVFLVFSPWCFRPLWPLFADTGFFFPSFLRSATTSRFITVYTGVTYVGTRLNAKINTVISGHISKQHHHGMIPKIAPLHTGYLRMTEKRKI